MTGRAFWGTIIFLGLISGAADGQEPTLFERTGLFVDVTDAEFNGYLVEDQRMSADASRIAFLTKPDMFSVVDSLRIIDITGSDEVVIHQNPLDGSFPRVTRAFDISDTGDFIVYVVEVPVQHDDNTGQKGLGGSASEIRMWRESTRMSEVLLSTVVHEQENMMIDRQLDVVHQETRLFKLSGDATSLFFINRFGPVGSLNDGKLPDDQTLYHLDIFADPDPEAKALYSRLDLANMEGIDPMTSQLNTADGKLATDVTGSQVLLPIGDINLQPEYLLRIMTAGDKGDAVVLLELKGTKFSGPDMDDAGGRMVVSWWDRPEGENEGLIQLFLDDPDSEILLDGGFPEFNFFPQDPKISSNGTAVAYKNNFGGSPVVRWKATIQSEPFPGSGPNPLPVSQHAVTSFDREVSISNDGTILTFVGGIGRFQTQDVTSFTWNAAQVKGIFPNVLEIRADPGFEMIRQPFLAPEVTTTWRILFGGTGVDQIFMFTYDDRVEGALITGIQSPRMDNGIDEDEVAGDNRLDEKRIWANAQVPDDMTGRVVIASVQNDRAQFVDFDIPIRDANPPVAMFSANPLGGEAPLTVEFDSASTGDINSFEWDFRADGSAIRNEMTGQTEFTYQNPGVYSVKLTVRGFGNEHEIVRQNLIVVSEPGSEGSGEGAGEGMAEGSGEGMPEGAGEGEGEGAFEGEGEGAFEGEGEGAAEGIGEGEGAGDGMVDCYGGAGTKTSPQAGDLFVLLLPMLVWFARRGRLRGRARTAVDVHGLGE